MKKRVCRTILQDYERRRKDERVKNWKEKVVRFSKKYQMKLERSLGDGSGMDFLKKETEGLILLGSATSFKNKLDQVQHR